MEEREGEGEGGKVMVKLEGGGEVMGDIVVGADGERFVYLFICLFIYLLFIHLFIYLSIHLLIFSFYFTSFYSFI